MKQQQKVGTFLSIPGYRNLKSEHLILHLKGCGNYTYVYLTDMNKPLLVSQTLKYFERQLPEFIRASKSSLVHPNAIEKVVKYNAKTMHLQLINNTEITVARRRIDGLMKQLHA